MLLPRSFFLFVFILLHHSPWVLGQRRALKALAKRLKRQHRNDQDESLFQRQQQGEAQQQAQQRRRTMMMTLAAASATTVACIVAAIYWMQQQQQQQQKKSASSGRAANGDAATAAAVITLDLKQQAESTEQAVDIGFAEIRMELNTKTGQVKTLLDGSIAGTAKSGRMLAILGPSGAGKSSILHALAGRVQQSAKIKLYGRRYINGVEISGDSLVPTAFVEQDASFFPYMTVRETLAFRVELKLGSTLNRAQRDIIVDDLIQELGLTKSADTIVGDDKVRGISGGERKRLSIAVEMISAPKAIFLDEPTSGLDSTAAAALTDTLRKLADGGRTVIAVIHQPSQHVFSQFDDLLLVSEGRQMYHGPRSAVRMHMESNGCAALPETGTAEHILDCISPMPLLGETTETDVQERLERLATVAAEAASAAASGRTNGNPSSLSGNGHNGGNHKIVRYSSDHQFGPKASLARQCKLLFGRALQQLSRGKATIILKVVQQITTALIYGGIYNLGTNQASIQDRFGLMSLIAIGTANVAIAQTVRAFPKEKAIVSKELSSQLYRTLPYFIGKAVSELPLTGILNAVFGLGVYGLTGMSRIKQKLFNFISILTMHGMVSQCVGLMIGAISPNSDVALAIFPAILILNIIFDGKNISEENTPKYLRWIPKMGLIRWGFEGFCVNEFMGLKFTDKSGPRRGPFAATGEEALGQLGLGKRTIGDVLRAQGVITGVTMLLSYLGLALTRQSLQRMMPPPPPSSKEAAADS